MDTVYFIIIFILINLLGFFMVAADKRKARKNLWRIPEKTFFLVAAAGGCIGVYSGMLVFRHKTRHWYFMTGIPFICIIQVIALYFVITGGIS